MIGGGWGIDGGSSWGAKLGGKRGDCPPPFSLPPPPHEPKCCPLEIEISVGGGVSLKK